MERLVYLFELDSVRNTQKEILAGQQALYEEIVKNGNKVVLSFNQLTDSRAFLAAVEKESQYNDIMELFKKGVIKISYYGEYRTASQYIQGAIEKCMSDSKDAFLFSGLPVRCTDKDMLQTIGDALKYSDPARIEELVGQTREKEEKDRLSYILRYINMILLLSRENLSKNPKKKAGKSFSDFMGWICSLYESQDLDENDTCLWKEHWKGAIEVLKNVENDILNSGNSNMEINNRTNWVNRLHKCQKENDICLAEAIVDLCYNYTIEDSISGVSKHYIDEDLQSFCGDFEERMSRYWQLHENNMHRFLHKDNEEWESYNGDLPSWKTAVRIVKNNKICQKQDGEERNQIYENGYAEESKRWKRKLFYNMIKGIGIAIFYVVMFCVVDWMMGQIEGVVFPSGSGDGGFSVHTFLFNTADIIIFGIAGSGLSSLLSLPDILESVKNIFLGIRDYCHVIFFTKRVAYKNVEMEK